MRRSHILVLALMAAIAVAGCTGTAPSLESGSVGPAASTPIDRPSDSAEAPQTGQPSASTAIEQPTSSSPADSPQSSAESDTYRLGPGDKIRVIVFNEAELSGEFVVDGSG